MAMAKNAEEARAQLAEEQASEGTLVAYAYNGCDHTIPGDAKMG